MKEKIDGKLNILYEDNKDKGIDEIIEVHENFLKEFESKYINNQEDLNYLYKYTFNNIARFNDMILIEDAANYFMKKLSKKDSNKYFMPKMDLCLISAISFNERRNSIDAIKWFKKGVSIAEDNLKESKKYYHDAYCCALGWLANIYYRKRDYKKTIDYSEKVLKLYESVKDLKGFYHNEYDPKVIEDFIKISKEKLKY